ncbi:hypothetical protein A5751_03230 [Mycolicibacterium fortuitum]|nr:hypothetical protein A5751_03230 [Mycolicibacterium fortuitum]
MVCEVGAERTVTIGWVEVSHHRVRVRVPADFDVGECDLVNGLAGLGDDGFEYLERSVCEVREVEHDPGAEFFDPVRYEEVGRVQGGSGGDQRRAFAFGVLGLPVWLG